MSQLNLHDSIIYFHNVEECTWMQMREYIAEQTSAADADLDKLTNWYWDLAESNLEAQEMLEEYV